jgi:hypothetical protein
MDWGSELKSELLVWLDENPRKSLFVLVPSAEAALAYATELRTEAADRLRKDRTVQPSYVLLKNGSGVLFIVLSEVDTVISEVGEPHLLYWPTETLDYQPVLVEKWRQLRGTSRWHPPLSVETVEEPEVEPKTSWEHLLAED